VWVGLSTGQQRWQGSRLVCLVGSTGRAAGLGLANVHSCLLVPDVR
jgi:hypothetical protein